MKMLVSTLALHVIVAFAMSAVLHLNDDNILDREREDDDDDDHDYDRFSKNEAIDTDV